MAVLRVTHFGEPVLKEKGAAVSQFDAALASLVADMFETMRAEKGVGLAAQQIDRPLALFVADFQPDAEEEKQAKLLFNGKSTALPLVLPLAVVNAELELLDSDLMAYDEGCLSFPNIQGEVVRPERVRLTYQDMRGERQVLETGGFLARIIQHEYDHTQGIVFTERMERKVRIPLENKLKKLKRASRDFLKDTEGLSSH